MFVHTTAQLATSSENRQHKLRRQHQSYRLRSPASHDCKRSREIVDFRSPISDLNALPKLPPKIDKRNLELANRPGLLFAQLHTERSPRYSAIRSCNNFQPMANLFELPRYIAVEGPIRVGKSTLAGILADRLSAQRVMEAEDNPFLGAFYDGERGSGFQAQFAFLIRRFEQLRALDLGPRSQRNIVTDFIFEKDKLFAYLNLSDQELDTYNRYFNYFREQLPTPDLVIYLQATPEVLKKRLKRKNAAAEKAISEDYLGEVIKAYEHFFFHYTSSDLLIVNTSEIDFVERNEDLQELLRKVSAPIKGTQYFLPLGRQEAASA
jgi:deoxyguanosine kinase